MEKTATSRSTNAAMNAGEMVSLVVGIVVIFYLGASLLPGAIDTWFTATFGNNTTSEVTLIWGIIPVVALLGVLLAILAPVVRKARQMD